MQVKINGSLFLLGIVFVVLKLTEVITWSWLWVMIPFWGGSIILIGMIGLYIIRLKLNY